MRHDPKFPHTYRRSIAPFLAKCRKHAEDMFKEIQTCLDFQDPAERTAAVMRVFLKPRWGEERKVPPKKETSPKIQKATPKIQKKIRKKIRKAPVQKWERKIGLPKFASYVCCRLLSLWEPKLMDTNCTIIGQYAVKGLLLLLGFSEKGAEWLSKCAPPHVCEGIFGATLPAITKALKQSKHECHQQVFKHLSNLGLMPLAATTIEHLLCKYRKVASESSDNKSTRHRTPTPPSEYQEMWKGSTGVYLKSQLPHTMTTKKPAKKTTKKTTT